jgi:hypothetical protein
MATCDLHFVLSQLLLVFLSFPSKEQEEHHTTGEEEKQGGAYDGGRRRRRRNERTRRRRTENRDKSTGKCKELYTFTGGDEKLMDHAW